MVSLSDEDSLTVEFDDDEWSASDSDSDSLTVDYMSYSSSDDGSDAAVEALIEEQQQQQALGAKKVETVTKEDDAAIPMPRPAIPLVVITTAKVAAPPVAQHAVHRHHHHHHRHHHHHHKKNNHKAHSHGHHRRHHRSRKGPVSLAHATAAFASAIDSAIAAQLEAEEAHLSRAATALSLSHTALVSTAPKDFICPITLDLVEDPVVCADGMTYERIAIEQWFASGKATSPVTNARLTHTHLVPNRALRSATQQWMLEQATRTRAEEVEEASVKMAEVEREEVPTRKSLVAAEPSVEAVAAATAAAEEEVSARAASPRSSTTPRRGSARATPPTFASSPRSSSSSATPSHRTPRRALSSSPRASLRVGPSSSISGRTRTAAGEFARLPASLTVCGRSRGLRAVCMGKYNLIPQCDVAAAAAAVHSAATSSSAIVYRSSALTSALKHHYIYCSRTDGRWYVGEESDWSRGVGGLLRSASGLGDTISRPPLFAVVEGRCKWEVRSASFSTLLRIGRVPSNDDEATLERERRRERWGVDSKVQLHLPQLPLSILYAASSECDAKHTAHAMLDGKRVWATRKHDAFTEASVVFATTRGSIVTRIAVAAGHNADFEVIVEEVFRSGDDDDDDAHGGGVKEDEEKEEDIELSLSWDDVELDEGEVEETRAEDDAKDDGALDATMRVGAILAPWASYGSFSGGPGDHPSSFACSTLPVTTDASAFKVSVRHTSTWGAASAILSRFRVYGVAATE